MEHFSPVLSNPEKIGDQWTMLKARIFMEHKKSFEKLTWADVGRVHGSACPDIMNLMDLIQVIPVATADCERGFNVMKRVKSDWRSRLNADTLSDLLLVQLTSPNIPDYDPGPAVEMWHSDCVRGRRPDFMDRHQSEMETVSDEDI